MSEEATTIGFDSKIRLGLFWKILATLALAIFGFLQVKDRILETVAQDYVEKGDFEILNIKMDVLAMMLLENGEYNRFLDLTRERTKN